MKPISVEIIFDNKFIKTYESGTTLYKVSKNSEYKIKITNNTNNTYFCVLHINDKTLENIIVDSFNYIIIDSLYKRDKRLLFNGIAQNIYIHAQHDTINDTKWLKPKKCNKIIENNKLVFSQNIFYEETNKPDFLIANYIHNQDIYLKIEELEEKPDKILKLRNRQYEDFILLNSY